MTYRAHGKQILASDGTHIAEPTVYHGTPLTPRAALSAILPGRAGCVSFYRPEDLEAVLAVCPQVMFRSRSIFLLDASYAGGSGVGRSRPSPLVERLLRLAGADFVRAWSVGDHAGQSCGALANQRRPIERMAVRSPGRSGMAHGRVNRTIGEALRPLSARVRRMDRRPEARAGGLRGLFPQDGRGCQADGQHVASATHAARHPRCSGVSLHQRGQHVPCTERPPL